MPALKDAVPTNRGEQRRRIHLINVSLPKTGSTSIVGLFARNFRASHEFLLEEATAAIRAYRDGLLDESALRRVLRDRDAAGGLEIDSATFNHAYARILVTEFPDARF